MPAYRKPPNGPAPATATRGATGCAPSCGMMSARPASIAGSIRNSPPLREKRAVMPSSNTDPSFLPAHRLAAEIAARRLSPVDIVEALLSRIEAHNPKLHAFIEIYADDARLAAEAADKAIRSGH